MFNYRDPGSPQFLSLSLILLKNVFIWIDLLFSSSLTALLRTNDYSTRVKLLVFNYVTFIE